MAIKDFNDEKTYRKKVLDKIMQGDEVGQKLSKQIDDIIMKAVGKYDPKFYMRIMKIYTGQANEQEHKRTLSEMHSRLARKERAGDHAMLIKMDDEPLVSISFEYDEKGVKVGYGIKDFEKVSEIEDYS